MTPSSRRCPRARRCGLWSVKAANASSTSRRPSSTAGRAMRGHGESYSDVILRRAPTWLVVGLSGYPGNPLVDRPQLGDDLVHGGVQLVVRPRRLDLDRRADLQMRRHPFDWRLAQPLFSGVDHAPIGGIEARLCRAALRDVRAVAQDPSDLRPLAWPGFRSLFQSDRQALLQPSACPASSGALRVRRGGSERRPHLPCPPCVRRLPGQGRSCAQALCHGGSRPSAWRAENSDKFALLRAGDCEPASCSTARGRPSPLRSAFHRGSFHRGPIEVVGDEVTLADVEVTLRVDCQIGEVTLEPQGVELPFVSGTRKSTLPFRAWQVGRSLVHDALESFAPYDRLCRSRCAREDARQDKVIRAHDHRDITKVRPILPHPTIPTLIGPTSCLRYCLQSARHSSCTLLEHEFSVRARQSFWKTLTKKVADQLFHHRSSVRYGRTFAAPPRCRKAAIRRFAAIPHKLHQQISRTAHFSSMR